MSAAPDPQAIFAAYHLGVLPEGEYRFMNLHQVAEVLGLDVAALQELLRRERLDAESILRSGFDLPAAQVEVLAAAMPAERLEAGRRIFAAYRACPATGRDWERELAEDAEANERTYHK